MRLFLRFRILDERELIIFIFYQNGRGLSVELQLKKVSFAVGSVSFILQFVVALVRSSIVGFGGLAGVNLRIRTLAGLIPGRRFFIGAVFAINAA